MTTSYRIGLPEPDILRRNLLETAKLSVVILRDQYDLRELRTKKQLLINNLRRTIDELQLLVDEFHAQLPNHDRSDLPTFIQEAQKRNDEKRKSFQSQARKEALERKRKEEAAKRRVKREQERRDMERRINAKKAAKKAQTKKAKSVKKPAKKAAAKATSKTKKASKTTRQRKSTLREFKPLPQPANDLNKLNSQLAAIEQRLQRL